jgi:hypothetical protein
MLKLSLICYILQLLEYIETHVIHCVVINEFFHILELQTSIHELNHPLLSY